ncbi:hypothetical protein BCV70DRAFT_219620 [Testicularia cyperi]|uniref:Large ribosomal subunit protein mL49 n=1 Tax=Testicularia cyperi TaxID=1882483 RepID=A0A317XID7_9BASI|nr:hypothetical protein BCV70DRAFT_219620 [Testicularia cyperi]
MIRPAAVCSSTSLRSLYSTETVPSTPATSTPITSTASTSSSSPESSSAPASTETAAPSESESEFDGVTPVKYSYFVPRVGKLADSLPVYTDVRNGGTRCMTEIRKIQGNVNDLKLDLLSFLSETYAAGTAGSDPLYTNPESPLHSKTKPPKIRPGKKLVPTTANPSANSPVQISLVPGAGKLKVRGNRTRQIKEFLESRGF